MKWELGRQNTGYEKLKLFSFWRFDAYILRFKPGAYVDYHRDRINFPRERKHFRLNILLKDCEIGGRFLVAHPCRLEARSIRCRFHLFRPDLIPHAISEVLVGTKYILSLGVAI